MAKRMKHDRGGLNQYHRETQRRLAKRRVVRNDWGGRNLKEDLLREICFKVAVGICALSIAGFILVHLIAGWW